MKIRSSKVWQFFDRLEENKRCYGVLCKLCERQMKFFGNTTNLRSHLVHKHPLQWELSENGSLNDSNLRLIDDDESQSTNTRRRFLKVDVLESETENDGVEDNEAANIIRQMHTNDSNEEWLEEEHLQSYETFEPVRKKLKLKKIKREVISPEPTFMTRTPNKYTPQQQIIRIPDKDEYSVFGEYIANKLRKVKSNRTRGNLQQLITTILWQSEYGMYDDADAVKRVLMFAVQEPSQTTLNEQSASVVIEQVSEEQIETEGRVEEVDQIIES